MTYNQKRHIQLLKLLQDLDNQGKDFSKENPEESLELSNYIIAVEDHILWQDRYQISLSMEDFLNRKIDGEELCDRVYGLRRNLRNKSEKFNLELTSGSEKIKAFQTDKKSKKLSGFLTAFYCECDHFEEDYENDEFYNSIKTGFLNFQKALIEK